MSSYRLLRINASGVHPETIAHLEEFNDGNDKRDNIQSLLTYKNKDAYQKWKSVITDECLFIEHGTYSMWCKDNKRHQIRTFCDEKGRSKGLLPNHRANAMIDAGRFTTREFDFIDITRNQNLKDSWGSNYVVGNLICEIELDGDNDAIIPDSRIFGDNPIQFILSHETVSTKMKATYGSDLAMNKLNPRMKYKFSTSTICEDRLKPKWEFVDYHCMPNDCIDEEYKMLLRSWGVSGIQL